MEGFKYGPPAIISLFVCDQCGRAKTYNFFSHFSMGKKCIGHVHELKYVREDRVKGTDDD